MTATFSSIVEYLLDLNISVEKLEQIISQFSDKDKKVLIYDSLYDLLSQHAHGTSALHNIVFVDNKQKFRNFDCLQHGQLVLKVTYVLFDKIIQDMAKIYYEEFKISSHMIRMEKVYLNDFKSDYQKMYEDI